MRRSALMVLLVVAVVFAVIAFFMRDRYLEAALESAGESIAEAKVEIDHFHFSLFKLECSWDRLQVADRNNPWKNIVETGRASLQLEARPLFWRRVIVKEMILDGVRSSSPRTTDGSLPRPLEPEPPGLFDQASEALQKELRDLPALDFSALGKELKIDSLVDVNTLSSVQGYKQLREFADSTFGFWQKQISSQDYLQRLQQIQTSIESRLAGIDKINDVKALVGALAKADAIQKQVVGLRNDVSQAQKSLTSVVDDVEIRLEAVKNKLLADIEHTKRLARLQDLDLKDVGKLLFGNVLVQRFDQVMYYIALGRRYVPTAKMLMASDKVEKPPRFKGQDISFPFHSRYPQFLIRTTRLTAATKGGDTTRAYFLDGEVLGITNEPAVYDKPTTFDIDFRRVDGNRYTISGLLDHTREVPRDSFRVAAQNFRLGEVKIADRKYFPRALTANKGDVVLTGLFAGDQIDLKLSLVATPVMFVFDDASQDKIARTIREIVTSLQRLEVSAEMVGERSDYRLLVGSNIDNVLGGALKNVVEKNLNEARQRLEKRVRDEVEQRRRTVEGLIDNKKQTLLAEVDKVKQSVDAQLAQIDEMKKELQDRIDAEKKKVEQQVGKEAQETKKKLENLLKKPKP